MQYIVKNGRKSEKIFYFYFVKFGVAVICKSCTTAFTSGKWSMLCRANAPFCHCKRHVIMKCKSLLSSFSYPRNLKSPKRFRFYCKV